VTFRAELRPEASLRREVPAPLVAAAHSERADQVIDFAVGHVVRGAALQRGIVD
jgi:hypothetical protein